MAKKAKGTKQKKLPKKMSALIKVALADIRKAERMPMKYVIEMNSGWYDPNVSVECTTLEGTVIETHKVCILCAAGCVMAFSLGAKNRRNGALPATYGVNNEKCLLAIDGLRSGDVGDAAVFLGLVPDYDMDDPHEHEIAINKFRKFNMDVPDYDRDKPEPFHKAMAKLQAKLEKAGL